MYCTILLDPAHQYAYGTNCFLSQQKQSEDAYLKKQQKKISWKRVVVALFLCVTVAVILLSLFAGYISDTSLLTPKLQPPLNGERDTAIDVTSLPVCSDRGKPSGVDEPLPRVYQVAHHIYGYYSDIHCVKLLYSLPNPYPEDAQVACDDGSSQLELKPIWERFEPTHQIMYKAAYDQTMVLLQLPEVTILKEWNLNDEVTAVTDDEYDRYVVLDEWKTYCFNATLQSRLQFLADVTVSPSGRYVAYIIGKSNLSGLNYSEDIQQFKQDYCDSGRCINNVDYFLKDVTDAGGSGIYVHDLLTGKKHKIPGFPKNTLLVPYEISWLKEGEVVIKPLNPYKALFSYDVRKNLVTEIVSEAEE